MSMINDLKKYLIERLKERPTWISLSAFFASLQYKVTDALMDDALSFFIILCSLAIVFTPEKNN